ncbi:hypothetical protein F5884DRAFT_706884 [Xylogone sp. PMI_703]|nr:hypothetical protein F5884DRAFT_706884 [Xylogone sp. PMI_703]
MMSQQPLPSISPGIINTVSMDAEEPTNQALAVLTTLNTALATNNAEMLESCFFSGQAYWKDILALTYHLRTFTTPFAIAASLLETKTLRGCIHGFELEGKAQFVPATPVLQFIDFRLAFKTSSPAATCSGRILLLPVESKEQENGDGILAWKIWILSTKLENLDLHPENEALLQSPKRQLDVLETIETDVFIVGGGNAAVTLAARLKALGVDSIMVDRNARVGDNWALRYDSMRFHVPTSFCELPYMRYGAELQTPHLLTKDDLAEQVRRYVTAFNLNTVNSVEIIQTTQMPDKRWSIRFQTPLGICTAVAKHLVQATGIGSQKPYLPPMADEKLYNGITMHSQQYRNANELKKQGASSVLVIGSANTAFDILEECHMVGLQTTMVARSATYICPLEYVLNKVSLGSYDNGVEASDALFLTLPSVVDGQLARDLFRHLASQEPNRYTALAEAGFPVFDSCDASAALLHNLIERAGGHYVDTGATALIVEGKAGIKAGVEPVGYTATGLLFTDGSTAEADAVIWCTGFADKDTRDTVAEILKAKLPVDATLGVDQEGEIRGMWKRHLRVDNYWVMGGYTQQHRWHSRTLALQIKAALEGVLPPAYRDTPGPKTSAK